MNNITENVKAENAVDVAQKQLKDAVINLRKILVDQKREPESKATQEQQADHWINEYVTPITKLADAVREAQEQLKIIDAKAKLESFDLETKLEVLGLTKETLLAQLGISLPAGKSASSAKNQPEMITIKYLNKAGEIQTKEVDNAKQITAKNYPDDVELIEFWNYCKELKTNKGSVLDDAGKKVYIISKQYLAETSDETLKEQFKPYYTA
ncbi:hypothetical protein [Aeromonas dhakensis]|uniref:hypothetical protein n=1 Tax=Aeromonas dhakensis TaxID=196024 RepID=UPI001B39F3A5|nr:hypothetical protein [Aeromonas dhakensis]MBQ4672275.1 hypothetical protein [Aeromonas dhakensis]